jgi:uncharacterized membrane protein
VTARRSGLVVAAVALIGLAIAIYLTATKLAGGLPVCGVVSGCEDVANSQYSDTFGIPTAAYGVVYSAVIAVLGLAWWRLGDRRAILVAYGLGLFASLFVVYLTYLELFVIRATCVWCVGYGVTVIGGWIVVTVILRAAPDRA